MTCDNTVCSFGKDQKLPSESEAPYTGQEVAWKGLGKIPAEHLSEFAPQHFEKVAMPTGAKMLGGAQPVPKGGLQSITGETGITVTAEVSQQSR
jgi:hypothetical protein